MRFLIDSVECDTNLDRYKDVLKDFNLETINTGRVKGISYPNNPIYEIKNYIILNDLNDLNRLKKAVGELIISEFDYEHCDGKITIHDGYLY
jgi:hypothetical protein